MARLLRKWWKASRRVRGTWLGKLGEFVDRLWSTTDMTNEVCTYAFDSLILRKLTLFSICVIPGRNMSIIPIGDKIRSLSILINRQISEIDESRSHNFL